MPSSHGINIKKFDVLFGSHQFLGFVNKGHLQKPLLL
jgi:hypothetical protein